MMIIQTWERLAPREKQMLIAGGILVGFFLLYELLIAPMHHALENVRTARQQDTQLLQWMENTSQKIIALGSTGVKGKLVGTEALLTTLDQSVRDSALAKNMTSIQQNANNTVEVKFQQVAFDDLTQWMINIRQAYSIQAKQVLITRLNKPGFVQADIIFAAA